MFGLVQIVKYDDSPFILRIELSSRTLSMVKVSLIHVGPHPNPNQCHLTWYVSKPNPIERVKLVKKSIKNKLTMFR